MNGEYDFAAMLVERFTCYHRRSYVCKAGVGDIRLEQLQPLLNTMESKTNRISEKN